MELKQYVQDAIRTESRIKNVIIQELALNAAMKSFIAAGNLLDLMKKNIYYGKPIDQVQWNNTVDQMGLMVNALQDNPFYQLSTETGILPVDPRVFHAIIGIATESTELVEAIVKAQDTKTDIDRVNVLEELGDINWYHAIAVDATNADWEQIHETNIAKLKKRYPAKFSDANAINRDLTAERKILEAGAGQQLSIDL